MTKEEYHQLLKDGRWQRRRLEIMQRDDFKCTKCGTTNDLNVHHLRYIDGRKPWEYEDADLVTLCGDCHKATHEEMERERQEEIEYDEGSWRVRQLDGLLLYYKEIGDLHDVITMIQVEHDDYPVLYDVGFYWKDVMPYSPSWRFSGCAGANPVVFGMNECKEVYRHVWSHNPDEILTKEQLANVREGFNIDKESIDEDYWIIVDSALNYAEKKYNEQR